MPRTPEFDRTRTLNRALKLFWARGYTATSLADLLEAMGIARSSFYASFGDKRSLFIECLEVFGDVVDMVRIAVVRQDDLLPELRINGVERGSQDRHASGAHQRQVELQFCVVPRL